jgi:hypothetical protein
MEDVLLMTAGELKGRLARNSIPDSATLMSDSGWECGPSDMNGLYYNKSANTVVFTQRFSEYERTYLPPDWKELR